jgi:hypothetical protein
LELVSKATELISDPAKMRCPSLRRVVIHGRLRFRAANL